MLASLLRCSSYSVTSAGSEEEALAQLTRQPPFLIILTGDHQNWSHALLQDLRAYASTYRTTFVALTDFHAPRWMHQEENPGFDGFLVYPLSSEVLSSLVQSAHTRQAFCLAV